MDPPSQSSGDGVCLRAIKVGVIGVFLVEILNRWTSLVCLFLIVKHFSVFLPEFKNWWFILASDSKSQDLGNGLLLCFFLQNDITHSSGQKSPFPGKSFQNFENEEETPILFSKTSAFMLT